MNPTDDKQNDQQPEPATALEIGIAESNRRVRSDFDGLRELVPEDGSRLLADILSELRDVLLNRYSDKEARDLLEEHKPAPGYRNVTPVPYDDVVLALRLLGAIRVEMQLNGGEFSQYVLGSAGARDRRTHAGRRQGGKNTGKHLAAEASEWHAECVAKARALLAQGKSQRELAAILAKQFSVSARRVRDILKKRK